MTNQWQVSFSSQCKPVLMPCGSTSCNRDAKRVQREAAAEYRDQFSDSDMVSPLRVRIIHARQLLEGSCKTRHLALRRAARCGGCHSDVQSCMAVYWERDSAMQVRRLTPDNTRHGVGVWWFGWPADERTWCGLMYILSMQWIFLCYRQVTAVYRCFPARQFDVNRARLANEECEHGRNIR